MVRELARRAYVQVKQWPVADRDRFVAELWKSGMLEEGAIVPHLCRRFAKSCGKREFAMFEQWINRYVRNWAHCDGVSTWLIAACIANRTLVPDSDSPPPRCTRQPPAIPPADPVRSQNSVPRVLWPRQSTTAHGDSADSSFEVIHPHHPLKGQRFKLVTYRHNWGEDRVYFHHSGGRLCSIPACWTTAVVADPFVTLAAGRCLFRYEDLLKLADLVEKAR